MFALNSKLQGSPVNECSRREGPSETGDMECPSARENSHPESPLKLNMMPNAFMALAEPRNASNRVQAQRPRRISLLQGRGAGCGFGLFPLSSAPSTGGTLTSGLGWHFRLCLQLFKIESAEVPQYAPVMKRRNRKRQPLARLALEVCAPDLERHHH